MNCQVVACGNDSDAVDREYVRNGNESSISSLKYIDLAVRKQIKG